MTRTDDDSWDLAGSVGATATGAAALRALASRLDDPLISDPLAAPLVRAVGIDFFARLVDGRSDPAEVEKAAVFTLPRPVEMMAVRTRFFDDHFVAAAEAGIDQAVILAAGLDSRAYRLRWPAAMTVYEIDQPEVIDFKTATLAGLGAAPAAERRAVGVDLRDDWTAALSRAGFDPARPTVWSAEGLLSYLPPAAQDRLLDEVTALSATGSRFAAENVPALSAIASTSRRRGTRERWREQGLDIDLAELMYVGPRNDLADYLGARGWLVTQTGVGELLTAHGLPAPEIDTNEPILNSLRYLSATRR